MKKQYAGISKKMFGYVLTGAMIFGSIVPSQSVEAAGIVAHSQSTMDLNLSVNSWGMAYGVNAVLSNNTDKNIDSWKVTFQKEIDIDAIWCAQSTVVDGKTVITPLEWNKKVNADSTVTFGYNGNGKHDENIRYEIAYLIDVYAPEPWLPP